MNPANSNPFGEDGDSAWMRPYPPNKTPVPDGEGGVRMRTVPEYRAMFDQNNKEAWDRGVQETNERRAGELFNQYRQWQQGNRR